MYNAIKVLDAVHDSTIDSEDIVELIKVVGQMNENLDIYDITGLLKDFDKSGVDLDAITSVLGHTDAADIINVLSEAVEDSRTWADSDELDSTLKRITDILTSPEEEVEQEPTPVCEAPSAAVGANQRAASQNQLDTILRKLRELYDLDESETTGNIVDQVMADDKIAGVNWDQSVYDWAIEKVTNFAFGM